MQIFIKIYITENDTILIDMTNHGTMKKIVPYGMCLDKDGNIYVCMNGGGKIMKINTKYEISTNFN